jgi:SAM-dependent methyltransferase
VEDYKPETYGDRIASVYDHWVGGRVSVEAAPVLASLARGGWALELGIGTGLIALPLAAQGIEVQGIDASEAMVAQLHAKPGGSAIPVTIGDMADVDVEGSFSLIYVVSNTFFALLSQAEQVRCFQNVAKRLTPDGVFVIEAFVPDPSRFVRGKVMSPLQVELDRVTLEVSQHDPVAQRVTSQQIVLAEQGVQFYPVALRYAWPSELDLMAQMAGLHLQERWADWQRRPFTAESSRHVSVWGKAVPVVAGS